MVPVKSPALTVELRSQLKTDYGSRDPPGARRWPGRRSPRESSLPPVGRSPRIDHLRIWERLLKSSRHSGTSLSRFTPVGITSLVLARKASLLVRRAKSVS